MVWCAGLHFFSSRRRVHRGSLHGRITLLYVQCVSLSRSLWPPELVSLVGGIARALVVLDVDGWKHHKNTHTLSRNTAKLRSTKQTSERAAVAAYSKQRPRHCGRSTSRIARFTNMRVSDRLKEIGLEYRSRDRQRKRWKMVVKYDEDALTLAWDCLASSDNEAFYVWGGLSPVPPPPGIVIMLYGRK